MYATDRSRLFLAILVTLMALPALWWANRNSDPAGAEADSSDSIVESTEATTTTTEPPPSTVGESNLPDPEPVDQDPVFLDGPATQVGNVPQIAVPGQPATTSVVAEASYRRALARTQVCLSKTIAVNQIVTIVNLDNNRSTVCRVSLAPATQRDDLVMDVDLFTEIADLTDAPIPVEVRF